MFKNLLDSIFANAPQQPPGDISTIQIAASGAKRLEGTGHQLHRVVEGPKQIIYEFVGEINVASGLFELLKPALHPDAKWQFRVNSLTFLADPKTGIVPVYLSVKVPTQKQGTDESKKSPIEGFVILEPTRSPSKFNKKEAHQWRSESQRVMNDLFSAAKVTYGETLISHIGEYICTFSNPIKLDRKWLSLLESIEPKGKIYLENGALYRAEFFYETYKL